jgi:hypothetical protein
MVANSSIFNFKLFVSRAAYILSIVIILDKLTGMALKYCYFHQSSGVYYRTTFSLEKTNADIIILGNSRANHHYVPEIFTSRLGLSCYNAGRDGQTYPYFISLFKSMTKRYLPRIIILDLPDMLTSKKADFDRLSALLPYYESHPEIRPFINMKSRFEREKVCFSSIYPFNSLILVMLRFNFVAETDYEGYLPILSRMLPCGLEDRPEQREKLEPSPDYIEMLESMICDAKRRGIVFILVASPLFSEGIVHAPEYAVIAKRNQIPFFDYSEDVKFRGNEELFSDPCHLNDKAAAVFSNMLVDRMITEENGLIKAIVDRKHLSADCKY